MKQTRMILESLKDLDRDATEELKQRLLDMPRHDWKDNPIGKMFKAQDTLGKDSMFIFPDGTIIGAEQTYVDGNVDKSGKQSVTRVGHQVLHMVTDKKFTEDPGHWQHRQHPAFTGSIGTYHNIIFVAVYHTAGALLIPQYVEPTQEQEARIEEAKALGWEIDRG